MYSVAARTAGSICPRRAVRCLLRLLVRRSSGSHAGERSGAGCEYPVPPAARLRRPQIGRFPTAGYVDDADNLRDGAPERRPRRTAPAERPNPPSVEISAPLVGKSRRACWPRKPSIPLPATPAPSNSCSGIRRQRTPASVLRNGLRPRCTAPLETRPMAAAPAVGAPPQCSAWRDRFQSRPLCPYGSPAQRNGTLQVILVAIR